MGSWSFLILRASTPTPRSPPLTACRPHPHRNCEEPDCRGNLVPCDLNRPIRRGSGLPPRGGCCRSEQSHGVAPHPANWLPQKCYRDQWASSRKTSLPWQAQQGAYWSAVTYRSVGPRSSWVSSCTMLKCRLSASADSRMPSLVRVSCTNCLSSIDSAFDWRRVSTLT